MITSELVEIYNRVKTLLKRYEGPLVSKIDLDSKYDLWSIKDVVIEGRKKKEVYFAGLIIQSTYVGLYYMPVYTDVDMTKIFEPQLLKLLKGKSCFHIRKLDDELEMQISAALEAGFSLYKEKGWI